MLRRLAAVVLLGLLATMWLAAPASAKWGASTTGPGQARATTIAAPTNFLAPCVSHLLSSSVNASWTASTSPFVTSYEVRWGATEASPTNTVTVAAPATSKTVNIGIGSFVITVRAVITNWHSANSAPVTRLVIVGLTCT